MHRGDIPRLPAALQYWREYRHDLDRRQDAGSEGDTMKTNDAKPREHSRPEFDCETDSATGAPEDRCVREYLLAHMPLAV
jgi:hypothetical protein